MRRGERLLGTKQYYIRNLNDADAVSWMSRLIAVSICKTLLLNMTETPENNKSNLATDRYETVLAEVSAMLEAARHEAAITVPRSIKGKKLRLFTIFDRFCRYNFGDRLNLVTFG